MLLINHSMSDLKRVIISYISFSGVANSLGFIPLPGNVYNISYIKFNSH